jgi:hypothetical protein
MKLSEYAKKIGVSYRTAHNHWKQGLIKGYQLKTGTIIVELNDNQDNAQADKILGYYKEVYAVNGQLSDGDKERYYWLSGFLNDFLESKK